MLIDVACIMGGCLRRCRCGHAHKRCQSLLVECTDTCGQVGQWASRQLEQWRSSLHAVRVQELGASGKLAPLVDNLRGLEEWVGKLTGGTRILPKLDVSTSL